MEDRRFSENPRHKWVHIRLNEDERAELDVKRGSDDVSGFIRKLIAAAPIPRSRKRKT